MSDSSTPSSPISTTSNISTPPSSASTQDTDLADLSLKDISDDDRARAADLKKAANAAFASVSYYSDSVSVSTVLIYGLVEHEFTEAATLYSDAIAHNPTDATLFCNRAYARMKLEEYGYAVGDCSMFAFLLTRNV